METSIIRRQLHNYLEIADDKKIEAIYTLMQTEICESLPPYAEELKTELQKRAAYYESGKAKTVSAEESKERIQAILNRVRNEVPHLRRTPSGASLLLICKQCALQLK